MFSPKRLDRFCLLQKFDTVNIYDFSHWDEFFLVSLKMNPSGGKVEGQEAVKD
jgi:hypothetical protein